MCHARLAAVLLVLSACAAPRAPVPPSPAVAPAVAPAESATAAELEPVARRRPPDAEPPIRRVMPFYSKPARGLCAGWVQLRYTIEASGEVRDPAIVASCPDQTLDAAAVAALVQWRYRPRDARRRQQVLFRYRAEPACDCPLPEGLTEGRPLRSQP